MLSGKLDWLIHAALCTNHLPPVALGTRYRYPSHYLQKKDNCICKLSMIPPTIAKLILYIHERQLVRYWDNIKTAVQGNTKDEPVRRDIDRR